MKKDMNEILNWSELGKYFANIDSTQQTAFFQGMLHEMSLWGNRTDGEYQLTTINIGLTNDERRALSALTVYGDE